MNDEFQLMRNFLTKAVHSVADQGEFSTGCYRRLCQVLVDLNSAGVRDIVALIRNILRSEQEIQGGANQVLRVPSGHPWPQKSVWKESGITVAGESEGNYILQAKPWLPDWLNIVETISPESVAFKEEKRRFLPEVDGDPFLAKVNMKNYTCFGQREAVRSVLTAPEGSTLLVILPTGAGKSLCAHLPGILGKPRPGITVVVVPTIALALDQERSLGQIISHPTAYYGAVTNEDKERNKDICRRIKEGSQQIVFTSPESLTSSLLGPVYQAACRGYLNMFVIDECHIVNQWGDEFRSEFQEIAGLRRDLLRVSPGSSFQTLLLSATVTDSTLETLEILFGKPGPFGVVPAVQVRTEPEYWVAKCENDEIREERLIEAVNNLPRPLIIYVSKVDDAYKWSNKLQSLGYCRIEVVTGKTNSDDRFKIIEKWRQKKTDVIVATSAFGLGVDQGDIRSVIHACVPENIDRFYQEVGRGGRDGRACVSLLLYTEADIKTAYDLNRKKIIGLERGLKRWKSMFSKKTRLADGRFVVPIDVSPGYDINYIDMQNSYNNAWNIRTLTLMSRAGLIELDSQLPPWLETLPDNEQDEEINNESDVLGEKIQSYKNARVVNICHDRHLDMELWETLVEPLRKRSYSNEKRNFRLMQEVLEGERCIGQILAEVYTLKEYSQPFPTIVPGCGGCPYCRTNNIETYPSLMPKLSSTWQHISNKVGSELNKLLDGNQIIAIFYNYSSQDEADKRLWGRFLKWSISQGICNIVLPNNYRDWFYASVRGIENEVVFLFDEYKPLLMPKMPLLYIYLNSDSIEPHHYRSILNNNGIPKLLFLPSDLKDPERNHCALKTTIPCKSYSFNEIMAEVGL